MKDNFAKNVSKAMSGDADAFAQLYSLVYKDLYYIALCNLRNSNDAADVVSDAVLDAFTSIANLKNETAFKPWIIKILTIKIKRKQAYIINYKNNTTELSEEIEQKSVKNQDDFVGLEIIEQVNHLNENEKLAFSLSAICGYSSDEISQMTGINSATVRSHLLRGREKLKQKLSVE